jgi:NAD(P)H-hydrate epimerase
MKQLLAPRARDSHKGDYGHVLVIGGDHGFGGAALMAAEAALRSGAGLTSLCTRPEHIGALLQRRPELMVRGIENSSDLAELGGRATVLVVGPGLGQSAWSRDCLQLALRLGAERQLPIVLDADGLNWLSKDASLASKGIYGKWILTPHAGEAARLLGISRTEVEQGRPAAVSALQEKYGGVAILKGPGTLLCYLQGKRRQLASCSHGNPGMASGGMGDVLSGVLGALLAQHFSLADSARLGVCIHSKAADLAAAADGERGLLATDLLPHIRQLLNP